MADNDPTPRLSWNKRRQRLLVIKTSMFNLPEDQFLPAWLHPLPLGSPFSQSIQGLSDAIASLGKTFARFEQAVKSGAIALKAKP